MLKNHFTTKQASKVGNQIRVDWSKYDLKWFRAGLDVELEHGSVDSLTNVTNDDPLLTGKIALAHLKKYPDYYQGLAGLEKEAEKYWPAQESN